MDEEDPVIPLFTLAQAAIQSDNPFTPILFWMNWEEQISMVLIHNTNGKGMSDGVIEAAELLRAAEGKPAWAAFIVDAYGRYAEEEQGLTIAAGELDQRFAAGDPHVVEQLMLFLARPYTPTRVYREVYRHTPIDGWEWDDVEQILEPILPDANLMTALRTSVTDPPYLIMTDPEIPPILGW